MSVKFDGLHSPDDAITKLQACASSCPRESFKNAIGLQWTAIGIIIALITVLKIWGKHEICKFYSGNNDAYGMQL